MIVSQFKEDCRTFVFYKDRYSKGQNRITVRSDFYDRTPRYYSRFHLELIYD